MSSSRPLIASDDDYPPAPPADTIVQISDPPPAVTSTAHDDQQGGTGWRRFLDRRSKPKQREGGDDATMRQREDTRREEEKEKENARRIRRAQNHEWRAQHWAAASKCWGCCDWLKQKRALPSRTWSLSDLGLADFLESVANLAAMMILTLNIYCATFFLAWHPADSICVSGDDVPHSVKVLLKVISVCLPFTVCPLTLYIAGQAKALPRNLNALGFVSVGVMLEIIYILWLGGVMTFCGASASWKLVLFVTVILSVLLITLWGCCCYSPKCLRCCCCCCQREEIEEDADP